MAVEAKAPSVQVEVGYREASLYARHLNQQFRTGLNPCRFILSCYGKRLLAGYDDAEPAADFAISTLQPGTANFNALMAFCGPDVLLCNATIRMNVALPRLKCSHRMTCCLT